MSLFNAKKMDENFALFQRKLRVITQYPREEYLYPIMRSVPYQDLETRLDMALEAIGKRVKQIRKTVGEINDNDTEDE